MDRRNFLYEQQQNTSGPGSPVSPASPSTPSTSQRRMLSIASYGGLINMKKAQAKAAALRLAAVMANNQNDEDEEEEEQSDSNSISGSSSIGLAGGKEMRPLSPMNKYMAQRLASPVWTQQQLADEDNQEDDVLVSGTTNVGLGGGRPMRSSSPVNKNMVQRRLPRVRTQKLDDEEGEDEDMLVSGKASIGLGGKRAMQAISLMAKHMTQKRLPEVTTQQPSDKENEEDDHLVSGRASIGHAHGRAMESHPSMIKTTSQRPVQRVTQQQGDKDNDEDDLAHSGSPASGLASTGLANGKRRRSSCPLVILHTHQDQSTQPSAAGQSSSLNSSIEQPSAARSTVTVHHQLGVKTLPVLPSVVPISLRRAAPVSADSRLEKRLPAGLGNMRSLKERGIQHSTSALQDELDMLQFENESLLEKLQLAEERCEEAEARARLFEKQIANLGEGVSLEARLLSRKESVLQEREAASRVAAQTHGIKPVQIAALQTEAEIARDEATSALERLYEAECEIKALQTVTQRMMLTQEEMEEVVLKRCWLAHYWSLCVRHGIQAEIAEAKSEYWSSLAPLPFENVVAAGQRAKEGRLSSKNDLEEREKVLQDFRVLSGERYVESMLLVEKGLREMALLKIEEAVTFALAQQRYQNLLKTGVVKLDMDSQQEAFELSREESEDVRFKQAWLTYFWRRAVRHGVEPDIANERLQFWINCSSNSFTSQDAVDVELGFMELRKLGLENQLWKKSRQGLELGYTKLHTESDF